ncbi:putative uncharacterized protein DDB_G0282133 isoform X2 [Teleopsis dalmanni]|uniref:putative uncharacterized protein DDB_G0282133 isoform X2 n=1 Tax=Teleopsis dalmanni TaxID=139649 RepID=UPI0018CE78B0|nr:putative uncharacterized protein DDB_G0282133 isoform X2 [Teleopsis dalmanni]
MSKKEKYHKNKSKFKVFAKSNVRRLNSLSMLAKSPGDTGQSYLGSKTYKSDNSENSDNIVTDMDDNSFNYLYDFDKDHTTVKNLNSLENTEVKPSVSKEAIKKQEVPKLGKDSQVHKKISSKPCVISKLELGSADKEFAKIFKQYETDVSSEESSVKEKCNSSTTVPTTATFKNVTNKSNASTSPVNISTNQFHELSVAKKIHIAKNDDRNESNFSKNVRLKSTNSSSSLDNYNVSPQSDQSNTELSDDNYSDDEQKNTKHKSNTSSDEMKIQKTTLSEQKLNKKTLNKDQLYSNISDSQRNEVPISALDYSTKTILTKNQNQSPIMNKRRSYKHKYKHVSSESESEDERITVDKKQVIQNRNNETDHPYKKKSFNEIPQTSFNTDNNSNIGIIGKNSKNPKHIEHMQINSEPEESEDEFIKQLKQKYSSKTDFNDKNKSVLKHGVRSDITESVKTKEMHQNRNEDFVSSDFESDNGIDQQIKQKFDHPTGSTNKNKWGLNQVEQSLSITDIHRNFKNKHLNQKLKSKQINTKSENEEEFNPPKPNLTSKTNKKNNTKSVSKQALQTSSVKGVSENNVGSKVKRQNNVSEQVSSDSECWNEIIKQRTYKSESEEEFINQLKQNLDAKTNLKNKGSSVSKKTPQTPSVMNLSNNSENGLCSKGKRQNNALQPNSESGDEIIKQLKQKLDTNADYKNKMLLKRTPNVRPVIGVNTDSENNVDNKQRSQNSATQHVAFSSINENEIAKQLKPDLKTDYTFKNKSVLKQTSKDTCDQKLNNNSGNVIENEGNNRKSAGSDNEEAYKIQGNITNHAFSGFEIHDEIIQQFKRNVDNMMDLDYPKKSLLPSNSIGVSSESENEIESKNKNQNSEKKAYKFREKLNLKNRYDSRSSNIKIRSIEADFEVSSEHGSESQTEILDECEKINSHLKKSEQMNANNNYNVVAIFKRDSPTNPKSSTEPKSDTKCIITNNAETCTTDIKDSIKKMVPETNSISSFTNEKNSSPKICPEEFNSEDETDYENICRSIVTQFKKKENVRSKLELENENSDTDIQKYYSKIIKENFEIKSDLSDTDIVINNGNNNNDQDTIYEDIEAISTINKEKSEIGNISNGAILKRHDLYKSGESNKARAKPIEEQPGNQEQILYSNSDMVARDITQSEKIKKSILAKAVQKKQKDNVLYAIPKMEYGSNESDSVVSDSDSDIDFAKIAIENKSIISDTNIKNNQHKTITNQQSEHVSKNKVLNKNSYGGASYAKPPGFKSAAKTTNTLDKALKATIPKVGSPSTYNSAYIKMANIVREKQFDNSPKIETRVPRVRTQQPTTEISKKPVPNKRIDNITEFNKPNVNSNAKLKFNNTVGVSKPEANINLSPLQKRLNHNKNSTGNCAIQEFKFENDMSKYRQTLDTSLLVKKRKPQNVPATNQILNKKIGNKTITDNARGIQKGVRGSIGADKLKFNRNL